MDITIDKKGQKATNKKKWYLAAAGIAAITIFYIFLSSGYSNASYIANNRSLLFADVQRGHFDISVRGYGILVPKEIHWISTDINGRVKQIWRMPGDNVKRGDVLVTLQNPQLVQKREETKWELEALTAEKKAEQVALESKLFQLKATLLETDSEYDTTKLVLDAQKALIEAGNSTISALDHSKTKLSMKKIELQQKLQAQQYKKMEENLAAYKEGAKARLNKMHKILQQVQGQVDALSIIATSDGVVQEMDLELGQQLASGDGVAKIAQLDDFKAELKVQELQVQNIQLGQTVKVDTRTSTVNGVVVRIDPNVVEGTVQVEVSLQGKLPPEARPDLSVEGTISIADKENVLNVKRPAFASENSQAYVYRVNNDAKTAQRVKVEFGQVSTNTVEIISGLNAGDKIIISDQSAWEQHSQIILN
ncbi:MULTISPECIES: efflux RND transporter periplasmic adaptor subunit [unclassified Pseudoalteromonas]|uniref:efflux RND transporter periplasmic adaptor subunit n=1 Tax=unclassified Pseudoalteromonas TaxID=194690 RepID=UPI001B3A4A7A|nr:MULTISPECIES: HlyD family efflux transporter periplasmic adaptor subunit [unclassified Pseudoalteromonas]MBQ4844735.1 efflux RND transporter periplasmic adaptor subunit [Pseudoalteromonas sp. MMG005]MBQ4850860.1 efflux RND transporter periplasmic adaptor subunit [Pseudoalteromonas sp. MMG012]